MPVVAAKSAGPRALIQHEETGLLVPINDSKTPLKQSIVYYDAAFAENLVTGGFTAYEAAFTEAEVVRQYQEFFEKVTR